MGRGGQQAQMRRVSFCFQELGSFELSGGMEASSMSAWWGGGSKL